MKALEVPEPRRIRAIELPEPQPGPGEVRVRLVAGGLCGTDLHVYEGLMNNLPRIPGNDVAGVVDALGEGVGDALLGQRVTADIPGGLILTRELEVRAAKGGRGLYPEAIELVRRGELRPGVLVSRTYPARDAERAFAEAIADRGSATRALLDLEAW